MYDCAVLSIALCVGLLPFLINNLRNPTMQCKTAALHLVSLTLSAHIGATHIEAAHLSNPYTSATLSDAKMSSNGIKAQTFINRCFAALEEMLQANQPGDCSILLPSACRCKHVHAFVCHHACLTCMTAHAFSAALTLGC